VDLKNLPVLMLRLQIQLNSHGMKLDSAKFEEKVRKDNDVGSILKFCGKSICNQAHQFHTMSRQTVSSFISVVLL
jgi:hypothetical protein